MAANCNSGSTDWPVIIQYRRAQRMYSGTLLYGRACVTIAGFLAGWLRAFEARSDNPLRFPDEVAKTALGKACFRRITLERGWLFLNCLDERLVMEIWGRGVHHRATAQVRSCVKLESSHRVSSNTTRAVLPPELR